MIQPLCIQITSGINSGSSVGKKYLEDNGDIVLVRVQQTTVSAPSNHNVCVFGVAALHDINTLYNQYIRSEIIQRITQKQGKPK
jgi:hypothetical protein